MKWIINATLITLSLTGCIVYDEELNYDDAVERNDERPSSSQQNEPEAIGTDLLLSPNVGAPGDLALVSLIAEDTTDLGDVTEITFYGDSELEIIAEQDRGSSEIILAIEIANKAAVGLNHVLVEFSNGDEIFLSDAFEVVD
jgi:hypothetical protein